MRFRDRADAGRQLAERLVELRFEHPVVLALPRGGIPVGYAVAASLGAPLEVFVARKVGAPGQEELGIGAVAEGLAEPVMSDAARQLGVTAAEFSQLAARAQAELARRVGTYRGDRPLPALSDADVILVDDGLATGVTAEAALRGVRAHAPRRLMLAVPVCAAQTAARLTALTDGIVSVLTPPDLWAVGAWYEDFSQTTDAEVVDLLARRRSEVQAEQ